MLLAPFFYGFLRPLDKQLIDFYGVQILCLSSYSSSSSLADLEADKKEGANAARKQAKEAFEKLD